MSDKRKLTGKEEGLVLAHSLRGYIMNRKYWRQEAPWSQEDEVQAPHLPAPLPGGTGSRESR